MEVPAILLESHSFTPGKAIALIGDNAIALLIATMTVMIELKNKITDWEKN